MRARDNPFASERVLEIRYRLPDGWTWESLLDRLAALGWRAAIVGPHGRGKTTLLEDLAPRLEARGFQVRPLSLWDDHPRLRSEDRARLRDLDSRDFVLLDGAEQLGRLSWLFLKIRCRRAGGLLVTSHRPGLLPTLLECHTSPGLLAGIVRELTGEEPPDAADMETLFARHAGNLRSALRELYDRLMS